MQINFIEFFLQIIPLYFLVILGFVAGKFCKVDRKSIASLLFYTIIPVIFFEFAIKTKYQSSDLLLPFIFYGFSFILSFSFYFLAKRIWKHDSRPNIIGFSAGTGNTGYFGLPIVLMLFDEQVVGIYMLMNIGLSIYDYTLGAYLMAKSKYTSRQALIQVSRLPMLYAFAAGLICNNFGVQVPEIFAQFFTSLRGCYIALGMMMIGLGLSTVEKFHINWKFLIVLLSARFIAAPLLLLLMVLCDQHYFHLFSEEIHLAMLVIGFVPPAANTVVFATIHNCHPEDAATAVLIGTIFAMFYLPLAISVLF
jgi:malate permease and related proteins